MFVTNPVEDRLAQVCRKGTASLRLELIETTTESAEKNVLNEIGSIGGGAGPTREPAVRPPDQLWKVSADELLEGASAATPGIEQQALRRGVERLGGSASGRRRGRRRRHSNTSFAVDRMPGGKGV
jgi:hypothetical protein